MEPEVRERCERIEATLALTAENHRVAMAEFDKRMAAAGKRMDRSEEQFNKRIEATRKLVATGMRIVNHLVQEGRKARADTNALRAELRAFIKSQGNGHVKSGGNGRH